MKRCIGILTFLLCMVCLLPHALAEEIKVEVTPNPSEMSDSGMVAFSFVISNY